MSSYNHCTRFETDKEVGKRQFISHLWVHLLAVITLSEYTRFACCSCLLKPNRSRAQDDLPAARTRWVWPQRDLASGISGGPTWRSRAACRPPALTAGYDRQLLWDTRDCYGNKTLKYSLFYLHTSDDYGTNERHSRETRDELKRKFYVERKFRRENYVLITSRVSRCTNIQYRSNHGIYGSFQHRVNHL